MVSVVAGVISERERESGGNDEECRLFRNFILCK